MGSDGTATIIHALANRVTEFGGRTAIICGPDSISYSEFWARASAIARLIHKQVGKQDLANCLVAIVMANGLLTAPVLFGAMATGAKASLFNPNLPPPKVPANLTAAKPHVIVCDATTAHGVISVAKREAIPLLNISRDLAPQSEEPNLRRPFTVSENAPALCLADHGTTLKHNQLMAALTGNHPAVAPLTYLSANPLYHDWGLLNGTLAPLVNGATLIAVPRFSANGVLKDLARHKVQVFALGEGSMLRILVGDPLFNSLDFSALEITLCQTGTLDRDAASAWRAKTGCEIAER